MKNLKNILPLIAALALVNAGLVMAHDKKSEPDPMTASLQGLKGKEFESRFLKEMIHHHQSAVEMAELATSNTKRPELNKLGEEIITRQKEEIQQMTDWLKKDGEKPGSMKEMPGMDKMMQEMKALKKAKDAEFDKMFLAMMSKHHEGAVAMSKLVPDRTDRADLKQLASQIIAEQTKEIKQMKDWEKSWFGAAAH